MKEKKTRKLTSKYGTLRIGQSLRHRRLTEGTHPSEARAVVVVRHGNLLLLPLLFLLEADRERTPDRMTKTFTLHATIAQNSKVISETNDKSEDEPCWELTREDYFIPTWDHHKSFGELIPRFIFPLNEFNQCVPEKVASSSSPTDSLTARKPWHIHLLVVPSRQIYANPFSWLRSGAQKETFSIV